MPDVEGPMDPIDPPPSNKRRPDPQDTLKDVERHFSPRGAFRESKKPNRYQGYLAAMSTIVQSKPGSFEQAVKHQAGRMLCTKSTSPLCRMMSGMWFRDRRTKQLSPQNGSIRSSMDLMVVLKSSRQDSLPKASLKRKAYTMMIYFHLWPDIPPSDLS